MVRSVDSLSRVQVFCNHVGCGTSGCLSITILDAYSYSCLLNQWCYLSTSFSLVSFLLPPLVLPSIRVVSSTSVLYIRWPKYWSFSACTSSSKEYSGLILVSKVLIILNGFSRRFFWCQERLKTGVERDDIGKTIR